MFLRLHHMQLAMPEGREDEARGFFVDVLGMVEIRKPPVLAARGGVWFRAGGVELHLGVEDDFRPARKGHPGVLVDDVDEVVRRLTAAGRDAAWDAELPGFRRVYATDPFGNRLEFLQPDADGPGEVVRRGYDAASEHYRPDVAAPGDNARWLGLLGLTAPARVLDLGCGCGVPTSRLLVARGHDVLGVDVSEVQVDRARRLVPGARFLRADASELAFPPGSFDAVVCLYVLIHVPQDEQRALLHAVRRWLRPGGQLLATVGATAWTGTDPDWLGSGAPMWWSHPDADTYRAWLADAGFVVEHDEFVPERTSGHQLVVAVAP